MTNNDNINIGRSYIEPYIGIILDQEKMIQKIEEKMVILIDKINEYEINKF